MATNDLEVLREFQNREPSREIAVHAFGLYCQKKLEWTEHYEAQNRTAPTSAQERVWIRNLTPDYFAALIRDAREAFEVAARVVREVKDVGSTIIADVNNANSFWKQLRLALVTSILSPIIIGVLVFLGVTYRAYVPYWEDLQNKFQKASVISTEHTASKSN